MRRMGVAPKKLSGPRLKLRTDGINETRLDLAELKFSNCLEIRERFEANFNFFFQIWTCKIRTSQLKQWGIKPATRHICTSTKSYRLSG